jgi:hypothetical protein
MRFLPFVVDLFDLPLAGHGYDVGGSSGGGSGGGGDDEGGISTIWIVALACLALVTVGVLLWLNPSGARLNVRSIAPKVLIAVIIAAPLVAWTVSSRGGEENLIVERWTAPDGTPELLVSLGEDNLNTLETTNGKRVVRVECVGDEGRVILDDEQKWPFPNEANYDYPHVHQAASRDQLLQAETCRLRGASVELEADVEGSLTP